MDRPFYVIMWLWPRILGDSTRFLPAAAHAGYQQEVPAGEFPLICTLSSTPVQRNQTSRVKAAG